MTDPIDYLDLDIPLYDVALHQSRRLQELTEDLNHQGEVAMRFDEGIAGMQWLLSRLRNNPFGAIPLSAVLGMLDEIVLYANVDKMPGWLEHARRDMGRAG